MLLTVSTCLGKIDRDLLTTGQSQIQQTLGGLSDATLADGILSHAKWQMIPGKNTIRG